MHDSTANNPTFDASSFNHCFFLGFRCSSAYLSPARRYFPSNAIGITRGERYAGPTSATTHEANSYFQAPVFLKYHEPSSVYQNAAL